MGMEEGVGVAQGGMKRRRFVAIYSGPVPHSMCDVSCREKPHLCGSDLCNLYAPLPAFFRNDPVTTSRQGLSHSRFSRSAETKMVQCCRTTTLLCG